MTDRYTKTVLTVIAGALIYLCIVMTPLPAAHAQGGLRPGEISSGPISVVVTGWKTDPAPVMFQRPMPVTVSNDVLRVSGSVTTERSSGQADRVVLVGWEEQAVRERPAPSNSSFRMLSNGLNKSGVPVEPSQPR
jgi:hypothetical protein